MTETVAVVPDCAVATAESKQLLIFVSAPTGC